MMLYLMLMPRSDSKSIVCASSMERAIEIIEFDTSETWIVEKVIGVAADDVYEGVVL